MKKKTYIISAIPISIIVIFIIITTRLGFYTFGVSNKSRQPVSAYLKNANTIALNADSKKKSSMTATTILYLAQSNQVLFNNPHINITTAQGIKWIISAEKALSNKQGTSITLTHKVKLHQLPQNGHPDTTIKTEKLFYDKKKNIAYNHVLTHVQQPGILASGQGITVDFNTNTIKIRSKSRGAFVPQKISHSKQNQTK